MKQCLFWIACVLIFTAQSCTVEKRLYTKGYHVSSSKNLKTTKSPVGFNQSTAFSANAKKQNETFGEELVAEVGNLSQKSIITTPLWNKETGDCDIIYFKDGAQVDARILMISDTEVRYKRCKSNDEIIYSTSIDNVLIIEYMNGEKFIPKRGIDLKEKEESKAVAKTYSSNSPASLGGLTYHPLSIISFAFSMVSVTLLSLSLILLFALGLASGVFLVSIGFLLAVAAIILGIIALVKISRHKDKYKGKIFAILGLAFGGAIVLSILIAYIISSMPVE